MAAQFTLNWDNSSVDGHPNSTGQRASYRQKSVGGAWVTVGFTPTNDMATSENSTITPNTLLDNVVYEFKVENLCTEGGPTMNDNGVREAIEFDCLIPVTSQGADSATITLDVTGLDILKARFTLRKSADNSVVGVPTIVNAVANTISYTATGLDGSTNYYWQFEMYATINTVEVISSQAAYLGQACSPYPFTTDAAPSCAPVTSVDVTSVEIP